MRQCMPRLQEQQVTGKDWIQDFSSGYIQRKKHLLPKQGNKPPWVNTQNYALDKKIIREDPIDDGVLQFSDLASARRAG